MQTAPQVFLSYARANRKKVEALYQKLSDEGLKPWMDTEDLLPGQDWRSNILEALRKSDVFLACLSKNSTSQRGFIQKEIKDALDIWATKLEEDIYLIPVRLEETEIPEALSGLQWVDLFEEGGWAKLVSAIGHASTPPLPPPKPPEDLVRDCLSGECVLFVGAGLSARAGYPTWKPLVRGMLDWAIENEIIDQRFAESLSAALKREQLDVVADGIASAVQAKGQVTRLNDYLHKIFLTPAPLPESHRVIREIGFNAVLTPNFDDLLERTYEDVRNRVYIPQDSERLLDALSKREFFILKLYGALEQPESISISPAQYEDAMSSNLPFLRFMESLFFSRTILFVGASLEGIEDYLEGIRFQPSNNRRHYALVAVTGSAWQAIADLLLRRYSIEVLPYRLSPDYSEVQDFLNNLAQKVASEAQRVRENRGTTGELQQIRQVSRLKRICLENIGPFDNLEIELDQHWNILLGDNGVGKSTIIKAIAVAMCGQDAQPYAHRLIKSSRRSAKIILETSDQSQYMTELFRTDRGAEIKSIPGHLLELEGLLALGFPALRAVTWGQPKGPQLEQGKRRPTSDDLLPLVRSDLDPRLDELKQWIINLDYRIKNERSKQNTENRYERLLKQFFQIVDHLTGDLVVQFKEVDLDNRQVKVITDDGEIPFEALSLGTASLMGWIGYLLQRMKSTTMMSFSESVLP